MDKNGVLGELLEKGQNTISDVAKTTKNQILGDEESPDQKAAKGAQMAQNTPQVQEDPAKAAELTKEVVADFYAPSKDIDSSAIDPQNIAKNQQVDQAKLEKLRGELHGKNPQTGELHKETYYDPLFAYEHKKPQEEEERPAEKAEREKIEDLKENNEKKKKDDQDIAVQRAQTKTEVSPGVSG